MMIRIAGFLGGVILGISTLQPVACQAGNITGAGATFPYPVYAKWAAAYKKATGRGLNYQSIGSGGGIREIMAGTVTFGASDKPLKPEEMDKADLMQWPMIVGGIVPVVNLKGIVPGQLVLNGEVIADIYMGKIRKWNDDRIQALNPGIELPKTAVAPIHRADGSGTTFLFTTFLGMVSPDWAIEVGANSSVQWPVGIGAKGNEGVAGMTAQTNGAIGYAEYAYARQSGLTYVRMPNRDGNIVAPDIRTFQAAAGNVDWAHAPGNNVVPVNQPGADSWPIAGASFILMHRKPPDIAAARQALDFFHWAFENGDRMAEELGYAPVPDNVVKMIECSWKQIEQAQREGRSSDRFNCLLKGHNE